PSASARKRRCDLRMDRPDGSSNRGDRAYQRPNRRRNGSARCGKRRCAHHLRHDEGARQGHRHRRDASFGKAWRKERGLVRAVSYSTAVVILSDRAAAGTRPDACIPVVREALGADFAIGETRILPDDEAALAATLIELADEKRVALVLTSGGTGLSPRDRTPQATAAVLDNEIPGSGKAMRAASAAIVKTAMLSR